MFKDKTGRLNFASIGSVEGIVDTNAFVFYGDRELMIECYSYEDKVMLLPGLQKLCRLYSLI